jgi:ArsR family transcriptional regulator
MADEGVPAALDRLYDDPETAVRRLRGLAPPDDAVERGRAQFAALANEDRLRIVAVLRDGERCGCELIAALDAPQSTVSTHLRTLAEAGLVERDRRGRWHYYRLADESVADLLGLVGIAPPGDE